MRLPRSLLDALDRVKAKQIRTRSNVIVRYLIEGLVRDGETVAPVEAPRVR